MTNNPLKRLLLGRPLPSSAERQERLSRITGLAVLSSDALSSVAYASDAMFEVLAPAGLVAIGYGPRLAVVIAALLLIVAFSYRQTIAAYPQGGGAYIVARENLGTLAGLTAASALLIDYVLTVAVSVSAGVSAIVSAAPALDSRRVVVAVGFICLIAWGNLRGIRQSGRIFAVPTYAFIVSIGGLLVAGFWRMIAGPAVQPLPLAAPATSAFGLFVLLHAFASGCSAMTGVEAISNGIPAFEPPEPNNASGTLLTMAVLLAAMFLGITALGATLHVVPRPQETVLSQLGAAVFGGRNLPYLVLQITTTLILVLAANTSFADFPRLASILARDRFAPAQFMHRGDRLTFSNGIALLAVVAAALVAAFGARELSLIPLYAVGVFLSFTLSQAGMVVHWRRRRGRGWRRRSAMNAVGAASTAVVLGVFVVAKFREGAWVIALLIPAGVWALMLVSRHYAHLRDGLALPQHPPAGPRHHVVLMLVPEVNRQVAAMIAYARRLSDDVRGIHVELDPPCADAIREKWPRWGQGSELVVLKSPYRSFVQPVLAYLDRVDEERTHQSVTVLIPQVRPARWWHGVLQNTWSSQLRAQLLAREQVTVVASFEWPVAQ